DYDGENRVVGTTVTLGSGTTTTSTAVTYRYDGEGRRVVKEAGAATAYVYDAAGSLAAEYGGVSSLAGTVYVTADHLGSTRLVTKGVVVNGVMGPQAVERSD